MRPGDERQPLAGSAARLSKIGLISQASPAVPTRVDQHPDDRPGEPAAIRRRVAEQAAERVGSLTNESVVPIAVRMGTVPVPRRADDGLEIGEARLPVQLGLRLLRRGVQHGRIAGPARAPASTAPCVPVTRSTLSITSRTECGRPVPRL